MNCVSGLMLRYTLTLKGVVFLMRVVFGQLFSLSCDSSKNNNDCSATNRLDLYMALYRLSNAKPISTGEVTVYWPPCSSLSGNVECLFSWLSYFWLPLVNNGVQPCEDVVFWKHELHSDTNDNNTTISHISEDCYVRCLSSIIQTQSSSGCLLSHLSFTDLIIPYRLNN